MFHKWHSGQRNEQYRAPIEMTIDPNLIGDWKPKGALAPHKTNSVETDGRYFIADPQAPFHFEDGGITLVWGGIKYELVFGTPSVIIGVWRDQVDGDEWYFRSDGTATVHWSSTEEYFGRYEIRGTDLWYQEFRGLIKTSGNSMSLDPPYAFIQSYDWTLNGQIWSWFDTGTGNLVGELEKI